MLHSHVETKSVTIQRNTGSFFYPHLNRDSNLKARKTETAHFLGLDALWKVYMDWGREREGWVWGGFSTANTGQRPLIQLPENGMRCFAQISGGSVDGVHDGSQLRKTGCVIA
ncbi:hypothetical protein AOLI_G00302350 [Acnodon oligacanthus]